MSLASYYLPKLQAQQQQQLQQGASLAQTLPEIPQFADTTRDDTIYDPSSDSWVARSQFPGSEAVPGFQQALTALSQSPAVLGDTNNPTNGPAISERLLALFSDPSFAQRWEAAYPGTLPQVQKQLVTTITNDRYNKGNPSMLGGITPLILAIAGGAM